MQLKMVIAVNEIETINDINVRREALTPLPPFPFYIREYKKCARLFRSMNDDSDSRVAAT